MTDHVKHQFAIEKGIPVARSSKYYRTQYPWRKMAVGDSVFVPTMDDKTQAQTQSRVSSSANMFARVRHPNWKFTTAQVDGGVRVWRIE